jgi:hypothetical protein
LVRKKSAIASPFTSAAEMPRTALSAILRRLNLRALDSQTGEFFVADENSIESFQQWKKYRDDVTRPNTI